MVTNISSAALNAAADWEGAVLVIPPGPWSMPGMVPSVGAQPASTSTVARAPAVSVRVRKRIRGVLV